MAAALLIMGLAHIIPFPMHLPAKAIGMFAFVPVYRETRGETKGLFFGERRISNRYAWVLSWSHLGVWIGQDPGLKYPDQRQAERSELRHLRASPILAAVVTLAATVTTADETLSQNARCEATLAGAHGQDLFIVTDVYALLGRLDADGCPALDEAGFDDFVGQVDLNIASYALLEGRLVPAIVPLAPMLIGGYLSDYEQANSTLHQSAILLLLDIAYYPCGGNEACVGDRLSGWLGTHLISDDMRCHFGLSGQCQAADLEVPVYN